EKTIIKIDRELFQLVKDFELLSHVNPINIESEKQKFFDSRCTENPEFVYKPINIDPFDLKRKLHRLEVEKIQDISIQSLYESAINAYVDKVDILGSLGTERFLYSSLRYFGEPNQEDLTNAKYLIHLPDVSQDDNYPERIMDVQDAKRMFKEAFDDYGFKGKIEVSKNLVASAMVINNKKKVMLKKGAKFTPKGLRFLVHHEIGVHMVTTMNSNLQPLKVFNLGLPVNTRTQEGLAVLAEYLSGNITMERLRELGLRVIAVNMLAKGFDFKKTFRRLVNDYNVDVNDAFYMTTRIYRGGGFTKDHLYLKGFRDMYQFWSAGRDLKPLLIGKTSLDHYETIHEMIERGILNAPTYVTRPFENPMTRQNDPTFDYIVKGIK
ncbi:MAG: flavohemoglobin expression-modulating QEGLA motif protein, partial [Bacteroidota bacterium]